MAFSDLLVEYLDLRDEAAEYSTKDYSMSESQDRFLRKARNDEMDRLLSEMDRYMTDPNSR